MLTKLRYIIFSLIAFSLNSCAVDVAVVGCGYVGLTTAAIFANNGHTVKCIDIDKNKIHNLQSQIVPIYEPFLQEYIFDSVASKNIFFSSDLTEILNASVIYICVPTPIGSEGYCDLQYLYAAFKDIITLCKSDQKIICIKSTVPPGTMKSLKEYISKDTESNIRLIYNPEFMREGSAFKDICNNPLVLGAESHSHGKVIKDMYKTFMDENAHIIETNFETAEIIKYAWNSFSGIRIAYVNELAILCRLFDADIFEVVKGIALSEDLLPTHAIRPGPGFGGSCLPKDLSAFSKIFEKNGFTSSMINQAIISNKNRIQKLIQDILEIIENNGIETITLLGLSFKPNTSDIRKSPAIDIISVLVEKGIKIQAYDPKAMESMKELFSSVNYYETPYDASYKTDCILLLTEWKEFKELDLRKISLLCNKKIIIDTRSIFDLNSACGYGFDYMTKNYKDVSNIELLKKHGFNYLYLN